MIFNSYRKTFALLVILIMVFATGCELGTTSREESVPLPVEADPTPPPVRAATPAEVLLDLRAAALLQQGYSEVEIESIIHFGELSHKAFFFVDYLSGNAGLATSSPVTITRDIIHRSGAFPDLLLESIRSNLAPFALYSLNLVPAENGEGFILEIEVFGSGLNLLSEYSQHGRLYSLASSLRQTGLLRGFQILSGGVPLNSRYGFFSMESPIDFYNPISPFLQRPVPPPLELTMTVSGQLVTLYISSPATDWDYDIPIIYTVSEYNLISTGLSLEEKTIRTLLDDPNILHGLFFSRLFALQGLEVQEGVAYINISVPDVHMNDMGSFGSIVMTEIILENLRQFPRINYALLIYNNSPMGLHGSWNSLVSLREQ
jgi:hypothetical protein